MLRDAGVLETRRGRSGGSFVRLAAPGGTEPPTLEELRELTDWRRAVSGEAAALAAERHGDPELEAVVAAARATEEAVAEFDRFRLADARFHMAVAEAARSSRAARAAREATDRHVEGTYDWVVGLPLGRLG